MAKAAKVIKAKKSMTQDDSRKLIVCEAKVRLLVESFVQAGIALKTIRDEELFRGTHDTFDKYCKESYEFGHTRASQLISSSEMMGSLERYDILPLPSNERQVRMLLSVTDDEDEQADIWERVVAKSDDNRITASLIKEVCDEEGVSTKADETEEDDAVEVVMKDWNSKIESWARAVVAQLKEVPQGPWIDETRIGIMRSELKSLTATVRATKAHNLCPKCDGKGCKKCRGTGFVPKVEYDSMGK